MQMRSGTGAIRKLEWFCRGPDVRLPRMRPAEWGHHVSERQSAERDVFTQIVPFRNPRFALSADCSGVRPICASP